MRQQQRLFSYGLNATTLAGAGVDLFKSTPLVSGGLLRRNSNSKKKVGGNPKEFSTSSPRGGWWKNFLEKTKTKFHLSIDLITRNKRQAGPIEPRPPFLGRAEHNTQTTQANLPPVLGRAEQNTQATQASGTGSGRSINSPSIDTNPNASVDSLPLNSTDPDIQFVSTSLKIMSFLKQKGAINENDNLLTIIDLKNHIKDQNNLTNITSVLNQKFESSDPQLVNDLFSLINDFKVDNLGDSPNSSLIIERNLHISDLGYRWRVINTRIESFYSEQSSDYGLIIQSNQPFSKNGVSGSLDGGNEGGK